MHPFCRLYLCHRRALYSSSYLTQREISSLKAGSHVQCMMQSYKHMDVPMSEISISTRTGQLCSRRVSHQLDLIHFVCLSADKQMYPFLLCLWLCCPGSHIHVQHKDASTSTTRTKKSSFYLCCANVGLTLPQFTHTLSCANAWHAFKLMLVWYVWTSLQDHSLIHLALCLCQYSELITLTVY